MEENIEKSNREVIRFISKSPAKIIISGEHAVVYNSKALSCAINRFATCEFLLEKTQNEKESSIIELNLVNISETNTLQFNDINKIEDFLNLFSNKSEKEKREFILQEPVDTFSSILNSLNLEKHSLYFVLMLNLIFSYYIHINANKNYEFKTFFSEYSLKVSISLDFPHGAGLGSSAAVNVSLASCLIQLSDFFINAHLSNKKHNNSEIDKELLFTFSYFGEKFFHLNPSGIDNITSIHKGMIIFRNMNDYSFIKPSKIFTDNFKIFLIDTKIRRDTKKFIKEVKDFKTKHEKVFMNSIDSIDYISQEIYKNIVDENLNSEDVYSNLTQLFALNQNLLSIIQVSHQEINRIVNLLNSIEVASKLTGGGGGGYMIALVDKGKYNIFVETARKNDLDAKECEIIQDDVN